jgi:hypothetical protein
MQPPSTIRRALFVCQRLASIAIAAFVLHGFANASAQIVSPSMWETNGIVESIAHSGNTVYIGGYFTYVGPHTGGGVPLDGTSGQTVPVFPMVEGVVHDAEPDGSGGWYIAGRFQTVGAAFRATSLTFSPMGALPRGIRMPTTSIRSRTLRFTASSRPGRPSMSEANLRQLAA